MLRLLVSLLAVCATWTTALPPAQTPTGAAPVDQHPYGHLRMVGLAAPFEFFRATFGSALPCGARRVAVVGDHSISDGDSDSGSDSNSDSSRYGCAVEDFQKSRMDVSGAYAVVWRGVCPFVNKVRAAQDAGAVGVVIINSQPGLLRVPMGNLTAGAAITIPTVMIRNFTAPLLVQAWRSFTSDQLSLYGSLEPQKTPCVDTLSRDEHATAAAVAISPTGSIATRLDDTAGLNFDVGLSKAIALSQTGVFGFRPALLGGKLHTDLTTIDPIEFVIGDFSGIVLPSFGGPLSFPEPFHGCEEYEEFDGIAGSIVVVDRGLCPMVDKARIAQDAGAIGLIIVNLPAETSVSLGAGDSEEVLFDFFGPHVGFVKPFGDDVEPVVRIPTVMVSHKSAGEWRSAPELFDGAVLHTTLRAAPADMWDDLRAARDTGSSYFPASVLHRQTLIESLVRKHHPSSRLGSHERFSFLLKLASRAGYVDEVNQVVDAIADWDVDAAAAAASSPTLPDNRDASAVRLGDTPVTSYMTQGFPLSGLHLTHSLPVDCRTSMGHYSIALPSNKIESTFSVNKKLAELLRLQACLEKVSMHVSSVLGTYLRQSQRESTPESYQRFLGALLQPYNVEPKDVSSFLEPYVAFSDLYSSLLHSDGGDDVTVGQAFDSVGSDMLPVDDGSVDGAAESS